MSEIISITLSFFIFFIFFYAPLNINKSKIFELGFSYQTGIANLIINLNFLLIISLIPLKLIGYLHFYFTILLLISIFNLLEKRKAYKFDKLIFILFLFHFS